MVKSQKFSTISIIIPTLNEASHLPLLFADLNSLRSNSDLIIVDGGSTDLTISIAQIHRVNVIESLEKNRGYQLSLGASKARRDWLLFLHADSRLDPGWEKSVLKIIMNKKSKDFAWYFDFKIKNNNLEFRVLELAVALRSFFLQKPYGDQGLLIHKDLYYHSGGFSCLKIMEDLDLITRVTKTNEVKRIRENLYTDDKKWAKSNIIKRAVKNSKLRKKWRQGYNNDRLSEEYYS
ncbi:TIGR04283 family arsenosugar biosynthesis glycosyltransferase [Prochlorococcus marinus]|uniref:4,4'-diaponeurosporenoate glycosyltransferase n=1 Tax=Prochlorococcus marinus XMU1408 TaxID=2213228 RepID=A0A318R1F0_PROMR|nr:TIGR04283 family arsenosugar biosynthesis glycosyltransferase [Prochlorococcus marinus]MBW3041589.1 glycosyl transferase [Prochlorococcus marinus str. XMU1408]PYE02745.1 glycosyl transferase [Prochlorococcus marinus XMU1408]